MMKNIVTFYNLARKTVENQSAEHRITWSIIRQKFGGKDGIIDRVSRQKFFDPAQGEDVVKAALNQLTEDIRQGFATIDDTR